MSNVEQSRAVDWQWVAPPGAESTTTSYAALAEQLVPSAGGSVAALDAPADVTGAYTFQIGANINAADPWIAVQPYGVGSNNNTFSMRVWGWSKVYFKGTAGVSTSAAIGPYVPFLWIPSQFVSVQCTLGQKVATSIVAGSLWADTITKTDGDGTIELIASATDTYAQFYLNMRGSRFVSFSFITGSSATAMNALWKTASH